MAGNPRQSSPRRVDSRVRRRRAGVSATLFVLAGPTSHQVGVPRAPAIGNLPDPSAAIGTDRWHDDCIKVRGRGQSAPSAMHAVRGPWRLRVSQFSRCRVAWIRLSTSETAPLALNTTVMSQYEIMAPVSRRPADEPQTRAWMRPWARWTIAIVAALAAFGGCWWGLDAARALDSGVAAGVATVPFAIVLAVLGAWAQQSRQEANASPESVIRIADSPSAQAKGRMTGGINIGPGASLQGAVFHLAPDRLHVGGSP